MIQSPDIIIVGAGIVGAACAMECARGGLKTLVLERGPIAGGTTATGMGHIVVMDDSDAQFALTSYSRRLWIEQRPQLPREVEYQNTGTLWVATGVFSGFFFGNIPIVKKNFSLVILAIIAVSMLPLLWETWRARRIRRRLGDGAA